MRRWRWLVALGVAVSVAVGVVVEHRRSSWSSPGVWVPDLLVGVMYLLAGAALMLRRRRAVGILMGSVGLSWFAGTVSTDLVMLHRGPLVHLIVTYVGVRPRTKLEAAAVALGYVAAVSGLWRVEAAAMALSVGLVLVVAQRVRGARGRALADRRVALVAAIIVGSTVVLVALVTRARPTHVETMLVVYEVVLFVAAILLGRRALLPSAEAVTDLVVDFGDEPHRLGEALARAVGDPMLEIGFRAEDGTYFDPMGRVLTEPPTGSGRVATYVSRDGALSAMILHDRSVLDEPLLIDAMVRATTMQVAHAALVDELRGQIRQAQEVRRRMTVIEQDERDQFARRLDEGVAAHVGELAERVRGLPAPGECGEHAKRAEGHLQATLTDLDRLVRGLQPRGLAVGLGAGLAGLVEACPVTVALMIDDVPPLDEDATTCLYYVCAEALANVVKHARAGRVEVTLRRRHEAVVLSIVDDGVGGVVTGRVGGLGGLEDRVVGLGGSMQVTSPRTGGTCVVVVVPIATGADPPTSVADPYPL